MAKATSTSIFVVTTVPGCGPTPEDDSTCVGAVIKNFGSRMWRTSVCAVRDGAGWHLGMMTIIKGTWLSTIVKVVIIPIHLHFNVPNNESLLHHELGVLFDKVSFDPVMIPSITHQYYENHTVMCLNLKILHWVHNVCTFSTTLYWWWTIHVIFGMQVSFWSHAQNSHQ